MVPVNKLKNNIECSMKSHSNKEMSTQTYGRKYVLWMYDIMN